MSGNFKKIGNEPVAAKKPFSQSFHGVTLNDDYHWLRADNWQEAMREPDKLPDEIADYLKAENAYCEAALADTQSLQKTLVAEMRGRIKEEDDSLPVKHGPFAYWMKYEQGAEHPIFMRSDREGGNEKTLLDLNVEAEKHDYFETGVMAYSPDHKILAWSYDHTGSEFDNLYFRDLQTDVDFDYHIKDVGSLAWLNEAEFVYAKLDENHRPNKIFRHRLGDDPKNDVLVYEETELRFACGVARSRSGDYVFIGTGMNDQTEVWFIPTAEPHTKPQLIETRTEGLEYSVDHRGDQFIIYTNADGATDFKIVETPVTSPAKANWKELIAHKPGKMIISLSVLENWTIWMERENALPRIAFMDKSGQMSQIDFDEEAYALGVSAGPEFDTDMVRFSYSSPTTPSQTYDYDLKTGKRELKKEQEVPSGHNSADYVTRRLFALSHDGAEVPVTLLYHKDTKLDGSAPCHLYGYGSYGVSIPAGFSTGILSLVDRGYIHAIAHIRGGEEKGRAWYEAAKLSGKPNTFHDFIAAAEKLIKDKFTGKGNIVIHGGSAGGLLVGATVNMQPELFSGVIAEVPFVDMLNTILDDTLPLTPGEWSQWGNPIEDKTAFGDIASYSPYDNVEAKAYPAMLVTAGVSDPRVTYWEPAKWVARLRALKTDDNALLLHTNMSAGHSGKSGRFAALDDRARNYAFALKVAGLTDKQV